jgi:hypothetical protein
MARLYKKYNSGGGWLFVPIILVTWEAEIRRIVVQGQPRQTV